MTRDRIYVTAFRRPEILWHCLAALSRCEDLDTVDVRVYVDGHVDPMEAYNPGIIAVYEQSVPKFLPHTNLELGFHTTRFPDMGPVTFQGMRDALEDGVKLLMLVEEDVIVAPDFIRWSRAVHETFHPFYAYGIVPAEVTPDGDPSHVGLHEVKVSPEGHISGAWFCAWGCSWPRESLPAILEHDVPEYHSNQCAYLADRFPAYTHYGCAWDGLMLRVFGAVPGRKGAYPHLARCGNIGVYGTFRSRVVPWKAQTLEGRIEEVGELMKHPDQVQALAHDCRPCSMEIPPWKELTLA